MPCRVDNSGDGTSTVTGTRPDGPKPPAPPAVTDTAGEPATTGAIAAATAAGSAWVTNVGATVTCSGQVRSGNPSPTRSGTSGSTTTRRGTRRPYVRRGRRSGRAVCQ